MELRVEKLHESKSSAGEVLDDEVAVWGTGIIP